MLIGILLGVVVVMLLGGLVAWIWRASSCQRIIDAPAGEVELTRYGGIMCRSLVTSGLLVRLDLLDWGIRVRGIPVSRWLVPRWEARYDELAVAELVATPFSRIAIWFRLRDKPDGIGFLTEGHRDILAALERHDVPVNRAVQQIGRPEDMYKSPR